MTATQFEQPTVEPVLPNQPIALDADTPAWQEIEPGRYQPRRIRGSCHGRELG